MSALRCGGTVGLLAVLWLAALCTAHQQQTDLLDQLLIEISRAVQSSTQPLLSKLNSQQQQLDAIDSRLDVQKQQQLDTIVSRLDSQQQQLDVQQKQLDTMVSRLDSQQQQLDVQQKQLDTMVSRMDSQQQQLDAIVSRLDVQKQQLDGVTAKLASQDSRLDSLGVRLDGLSTRRDCAVAAQPPPRDCSDLSAGATSGVHLLQPGLDGAARVAAFCDLDKDGGKWTVFQRRADVKPRQNFYLGWQAYKEGFGELDAEFWWGLQHLWTVTSARDRRYELRIDLEDFEGGKRHAIYQGFRISSEADGFRLWGTNYTGDAGDSLSRHFGKPFSTKDKDQDNGSEHCAQERKGAWWYDACHDSNLNGQYFSGATGNNMATVNWKHWRGVYYSLKTVEMKIRPTMNSK